jgi:uncharacterized protein YhbP (UPF0306 family)
MTELADIARAVIIANNYLALGTADVSGTPWVSPLYYTPDGYTDFYWTSSPDTRHSRNIAVRSDVSLAIYDTHAPIGGAEAVYITATANQVPGEKLEHIAAIYDSRLPEQKCISVDELRPPALFRLYHARATAHSVLIRGADPRYGRGADSRMTVTIHSHSRQPEPAPTLLTTTTHRAADGQHDIQHPRRPPPVRARPRRTGHAALQARADRRQAIFEPCGTVILIRGEDGWHRGLVTCQNSMQGL